jgi:predicted O-methyltransferase YrrM
MDHTMSREDVSNIIDRELEGLPGWCTPEKGRRMAELTRGAKFCIELGVFGGRGLLAMALTLRDQGYGCVVGIDPYSAAASIEGTNDKANDEWWANLDYENVEQIALGMIAKFGLSSYAAILRKKSRDAVDLYDGGSVDVLHQDSNHSEEISSEEVMLWAPKMRSGGYWIFDDADWPTTQKAQAELEALGFELYEDHGRWRVYRAP